MDDGLPPDPWGLTRSERQALQAVIEHGGQKQAARALGIAPKTVERLVERAKHKITGKDHVSRLHHFIKWDRHVRKCLSCGTIGSSIGEAT